MKYNIYTTPLACAPWKSLHEDVDTFISKYTAQFHTMSNRCTRRILQLPFQTHTRYLPHLVESCGCPKCSSTSLFTICENGLNDAHNSNYYKFLGKTLLKDSRQYYGYTHLCFISQETKKLQWFYIVCHQPSRTQTFCLHWSRPVHNWCNKRKYFGQLEQKLQYAIYLLSMYHSQLSWPNVIHIFSFLDFVFNSMYTSFVYD